MDNNLKKDLLNSVEIIRDSMKNNMQVTLDSYSEVLSRLDLLTYLIMCDKRK